MRMLELKLKIPFYGCMGGNYDMGFVRELLWFCLQSGQRVPPLKPHITTCSKPFSSSPPHVLSLFGLCNADKWWVPKGEAAALQQNLHRTTAASSQTWQGKPRKFTQEAADL